MSAKKKKKQRREEEEKPRSGSFQGVSGKGDGKETLKGGQEPKKPLFVRVYDILIPGEYTRKQDLYHALAVYAVIILFIGLLIATPFILSEIDRAKNESSLLVIPENSFASGQRQNVYDTLASYGFRKIDEDGIGSIEAYGSEGMVKQYKDSYYKRNVEPLEQMFEDRADEFVENGIAKFEYDEETSTLKIYTIVDLASSGLFGTATRDTSLASAVNIYSTWAQMNSDGKEKLTVALVDTRSNNEYYRQENVSIMNDVTLELEKATSEE